MLALAVGATIVGRGYSASWRDEMVVLAPGLAVLVFVEQPNGVFPTFALYPSCVTVSICLDEQGGRSIRDVSIHHKTTGDGGRCVLGIDLVDR